MKLVLDIRVVAAKGEDAVAGQQVEVGIACPVDQVGATPLRPFAVEAEGLQHAPQLWVQMTLVERHRLPCPQLEELRDLVVE